MPTIIHECRHILGLIHQTDYAYSIMKQGNIPITKPTATDYYNVDWKY